MFLKDMPGFVNPHRTLKLELYRRPAGKVDSQVGFARPNGNHGNQPYRDQEAGKREGHISFSNEIDIGFAEQVKHSLPQVIDSRVRCPSLLYGVLLNVT
jgi:hypothetical protein